MGNVRCIGPDAICESANGSKTIWVEALRTGSGWPLGSSQPRSDVGGFGRLSKNRPGTPHSYTIYLYPHAPSIHPPTPDLALRLNSRGRSSGMDAAHYVAGPRPGRHGSAADPDTASPQALPMPPPSTPTAAMLMQIGLDGARGRMRPPRFSFHHDSSIDRQKSRLHAFACPPPHFWNVENTAQGPVMLPTPVSLGMVSSRVCWESGGSSLPEPTVCVYQRLYWPRCRQAAICSP